MRTSIECLEVLIERLGEEWKQELDTFFKNNSEDDGQKDRNCIYEFLNAYREDRISGNTNALKKVEEKIDNDLVYNNIVSYVQGMMRPYFAAAPLRAMEIKDSENVIKHIETIFNKAILRYNPALLEYFEELGFDNQDALLEFVGAFDMLCTVVIEQNYDCEAIADTFYTHLRLSKKICNKIASMIDENFDKMKINYLIEKMKA